MWSDKSVVLVMDTNIFKVRDNKPYDLSKLPLDKYDKLIKTIDLNNLNYEIKICFPEIVILELLSHHKRRLLKDLKSLKQLDNNFNNILGIEVNGLEDFDIDKQCLELKNKYFNELNIIKIPNEREELFNKILSMSLDKIPPFEMEKSDKGFKDSILFLSLIDYAKHNSFDKIVLFSKDKVFKEHETAFLKLYDDEVFGDKTHYSKKLEIIQTQKDDIISYITTEFNLFKELREYINNEFFNHLIKMYDLASVITVNGENFDIDEFDLYEDDTHIYQLDDDKLSL